MGAEHREGDNGRYLIKNVYIHIERSSGNLGEVYRGLFRESQVNIYAGKHMGTAHNKSSQGKLNSTFIYANKAYINALVDTIYHISKI